MPRWASVKLTIDSSNFGCFLKSLLRFETFMAMCYFFLAYPCQKPLQDRSAGQSSEISEHLYAWAPWAQTLA